MQNRHIHTAIDGFIRHLGDVLRRSALTGSHYRDYLNKFRVLSGTQCLSDITPERISAFQHRLQKKGLSPATQNYYLIALRNFIRWLPERERLMDFKQIALTRAPHAATLRITRAAITTLLDAPSRTKQINTLLSLRDRALLELLHETPLKLYEIPMLQRSHFDRARGMLYSPLHKNVSVRISLQTQRSLKQYLDARHDTMPSLFISHDRSQSRSRRSATLSVRSIQRMVMKYASTDPRQRITPRILQKGWPEWTD